ncbi:MAG: 16S rRNA (guanine(527)-N(7))-methyltransferase RsmG [Porphyromonadaceae bacterium]|nr:16S rRNA (guanine(527)-N(7))-methyltransferase RsmG [Porphyromonadaceae bacterium]
MNVIAKYFPNLTEQQTERFAALFDLYADWNTKINVISRKDIDNLYLHHILHSLSIAEIIKFTPRTNIIDVGTGGGFPGIPLAILFPDCDFCLLDSVGKKIKVASEVASAIGLTNCTFAHKRMEEEKGKYDFVVSRAVMPLNNLVNVSKKNIASEQKNALPNGIICLKGGELQSEIQPYRNIVSLYNISDFFEEEYFATKKAVYLPVRR